MDWGMGKNEERIQQGGKLCDQSCPLLCTLMVAKQQRVLLPLPPVVLLHQQ